MKSFLPFLCVGLLLNGCSWNAAPQYPEDLLATGILAPETIRPWTTPYRYEGAFCSVQANLGPRVAKHLGVLFDCERRVLQRIFGVACADKTAIRAYATLEGFQREHQNCGFTTRTCGVCDYSANEIQLALTKHDSGGPAGVMLHEGAHAYLHICFDFPVPPSLRDTVGHARLASVPWWLQEGLATYMEASRVVSGKLQTGLINRPRHNELCYLIKNRRHPPLRAVIGNLDSPRPLSTYYAAAWGLVYTMLHHPDPATQQARRQRLKQYLTTCKQGFFQHPSREFRARFAPAGKLCADFDRQWNAYTTRKSTELFCRLFTQKRQTLEQWEQSWHKEIRRL